MVSPFLYHLLHLTSDGRTFKEGFIEMTTDPLFYYIIIGIVGIGVVGYYVVEMMMKKEGEE